MSEQVKDGGPAFGHAAENGHCCGMSLRDYFATKAMVALLTEEYTVVDESRIVKQDRQRMYDVDDIEQADTVAHLAYAMADAMLRAREAK